MIQTVSSSFFLLKKNKVNSKRKGFVRSTTKKLTKYFFNKTHIPEKSIKKTPIFVNIKHLSKKKKKNIDEKYYC